MGLGGVLHPNQASALGLYDVRYIHALAPASYQHFYISLLRSELLPIPYHHALWFTGTRDDVPRHGDRAPSPYDLFT